MSASTRTAHDDRAVAEYWNQLGEHEGGRARFVLTHLRQTLALVGAIRRLPRLVCRPGASPSGRYLRDVLRHRGPSGLLARRLGHAVLTIPDDPDEFTAGRSMQTLRRKVRAAERAGTTWREVAVDERPALLELAIAREPHHPDAQYVQNEPELDDMLELPVWIVVENAAGEPLLLSVSPADDGWGALRYFRGLQWTQEASDARYLGTVGLAMTLHARGVRRILDPTPPAALQNGLRHFQRMVGFRYHRVGLDR